MNSVLSLPPLCPDITLYSIVGLTARLNGYENSQSISRELFGSPVAGLRHDFPSDLAVFCKTTAQSYGDVEAVLNRLTTLPYFLRFRESPSNAEVVQLVSGSRIARLKFILGLPASPIDTLLPLRHCPECALTDWAEYGFAYWRREHQLPSSLVCPIHNIPLLQSGIRSDGTGWSCLHLPLDKRDHGSTPTPLTHRPNPVLLQLALLGSKILNGDADSYTLEALRNAYLHGLRQNGLLTKAGHVRANEFVTRIGETYRSIAHLPPFNKIFCRQGIEGLLKLVRKPRSPGNPICHLLLINFLFGNWELFTSVLSWEEKITSPQSPPEPMHSKVILPLQQQPPIQLQAKLTAIEEKMSVGLISLTKACKEEGVDIGTAIRWLGKLGSQHVPRRPRTVNSEARAQAILMLSQGLPLVLVAKNLGLSKATIDRICNESPVQIQLWKAANFEWKRVKYRQAFLDSAKSDAEFSRKDIRTLKGAGYSWLYQHDRTWLSEQFPPPMRAVPRKPTQRRATVDWDARDQECVRAIAEFSNNIQLEAWERVKPRAILRRIPKLSFMPRLDRLPQTKAVITQLLNLIHR